MTGSETEDRHERSFFENHQHEYCRKLDDSGNHSAYRRIMDAVVNFDVGNATLAAVLEDLTAEEE